VSAGGKHTLFLSDEGEVYSTGANDFGQLGYETASHVAEPFKVESPAKAVQIGAGLMHSVFLSTEGTVYSFGDNKFGQLGLGIQVKSSTKPKALVLADI
jgi:large repetitive protein